MATPDPSEPAIDSFALILDTHTSAGDALHQALDGIDPARLDAFTNIMKSHFPRKPGETPYSIMTDGLMHTSGPDGRANAEFARKIQNALRIDVNILEQRLPGMIARARLSTADGQDELKRADQTIHNSQNGIDSAIEKYVASQQGLTAAVPQVAQAETTNGRRHFDKTQLLNAQLDIATGHASKAEIEGAQAELISEGYDIGKFGKNHDGNDGVAGKRTKAALTKAISGIPAQLKPSGPKPASP
jgi:hypothetical protein